MAAETTTTSMLKSTQSRVRQISALMGINQSELLDIAVNKYVEENKEEILNIVGSGLGIAQNA